jgi:hypothetical protein
VPQLQGLSVGVDKPRSSIRIWQDRISDPSLTVLLVLELCAIFIAVPLAAKGVPVARAGQTAALLALATVVLLSRNGVADETRHERALANVRIRTLAEPEEPTRIRVSTVPTTIPPNNCGIGGNALRQVKEKCR